MAEHGKLQVSVCGYPEMRCWQLWLPVRLNNGRVIEIQISSALALTSISDLTPETTSAIFYGLTSTYGFYADRLVILGAVKRFNINRFTNRAAPLKRMAESLKLEGFKSTCDHNEAHKTLQIKGFTPTKENLVSQIV